jgi:hypothetical protein
MASEDRQALTQSLDTWRGARFAVDVAGSGDHQSTSDENHPVGLRRVDITITTWHRLRHYAAKSSKRVLRQAAAVEQAAVIRDAMCYPGNLTATASGAVTGIIRGSVRHAGTTAPRLLAEEKVAEQTLRFTAIAMIPALNGYRHGPVTLTFAPFQSSVALGFTVSDFDRFFVGSFPSASAIGVKQPIGTAPTSDPDARGWYTLNAGLDTLIWLHTPSVSSNSTGTATAVDVREEA